MKYYLRDILNRLQKYSATLDQSSFLIDKPWVVASNDLAYQKLIFRKDGRVHLSKNGNLKDGKWEYLPEAQALIIDYGDSKKLYRHQFLDEAVLVLKIDGRENDDSDFFLLANESVVPDGDAEKYLQNKFLSKEEKKSFHELEDGSKTENKILLDGSEVEIRKPKGYRKIPYLHGKILNDGEYLLQGGKQKLLVESGELTAELSRYNYPGDITIWQDRKSPKFGDKIIGATDKSITITDTYGKLLRIEISDNRITGVVDLDVNKILLYSLFIVITVIILILVFN